MKSHKVNIVNPEGFAKYKNEVVEEIKSLYMPEAEIINERKMLKKHLTLKQHSKHIKLSKNMMEMFAS